MVNGDIQFKLGEFSQFQKSINKRFDSLEKKVDDLRTWKIKTVGFASGISATITLVATYIFK